MSGAPPTIEWYIARDGVQHGPISDTEMRKFLELGHLKGADLVWCAQFTAWQSGAQTFPERFQAAPSAPLPNKPASGPVPSPAHASPAHTSPAAVVASVAAPGQPVASPAVVPDPNYPNSGRHGLQSQGQPVAQPQQQAPQQPQPARTAEDAAWMEAMRAVVDADTRKSGGLVSPAAAQGSHLAPAYSAAPVATAPQSYGTPQRVEPLPAPMALGPQFDPGHLASGHLASGPALSMPAGAGQDYADPAEYDEPPQPPRRSWIAVATAAFAVILIVGGLSWFLWQNRTIVSGASAVGAMLSVGRSTGPSVEHLRTPPYQATGETKEQIDASLQKIAVWRYLKREFGDWYEERIVEIERMRGQKRDERAITQYLVDVVVTLRRRNALLALQSSPDHLKAMSTAFVANLKQLGSRDGATCYAFISHGETSPFMIDLSNTPAFAESLQKQLIAVFEAVVDARATKKVHTATRRQDYERLTSELTTRGWSQNDLATFSDPQKLSASLPDKVCTLVQDWFTTQLALKEPDLQVRLLAESLKPLVGG